MKSRLSKILAAAGLASRRGSERLIVFGRVTVNGQTVTAPGATADPTRDLILVDGRSLPVPEPKWYVLLYKPIGYVTTRSDPRGRPVVLDLVPDEPVRLFPVGRLDVDAEGLLLLTNDGEMAERLLHPRYRVPRVYEVQVRGRVSAKGMDRFRRGVILEDGPARPTEVRLLHLPPGLRPPALRRTEGTTWFRLTMTEGRHREVKRLCQALGHRVITLRRIQFGPLRLRGLRAGERRPLTPRELAALLALTSACTPAGNRL
jgi:pseudouridine synthase